MASATCFLRQKTRCRINTTYWKNRKREKAKKRGQTKVEPLLANYLKFDKNV